MAQTAKRQAYFNPGEKVISMYHFNHCDPTWPSKGMVLTVRDNNCPHDSNVRTDLNFVGITFHELHAGINSVTGNEVSINQELFATLGSFLWACDVIDALKLIWRNSAE